MKPRFTHRNLLFLAIFLSLAVGLLVLFGFKKTIWLEIDGKVEKITTRALTVGGAIKAADIQITEQDLIIPDKKHLLKNGDRLVLQRARWINILVDGEVLSITSAERGIKGILMKHDIPLSPEDALLLNGEEWDSSSDLPSGPELLTIQIQRAIPIKITADGKTQIYKTTASNVLEAIWEAGLQVRSSDQIDMPADSPVRHGLEIEIKRAQPITLHTQSGSMTLKTAASTVGEVIAHAGLSLQGLDYSIPSPANPLPESKEIRLVRVQEEVTIEQTPIQFETEYEPSDELELDTRSTLQPGEYGFSAQRVRVRYQDGVETSRKIEDTWTVKDPKPRIVGYGTKIVKKIADTPDGPIEYWRALRMYAVSYRPKETDNTTASGLPLQKGVAAIDRRYIPFYTRMYIPGYGEAIAADVGGGVKGRMIDLGYSNEDYVSWHQWVTVYFLWPPPDNVVWFIP